MFRKKANDFYYSFPIQLFILHFSSNLLLMLTWIILGLMLTGSIAGIFGLKYLFLTPEYLGEVNFLSYFLQGFAYGGFLMTWNLTTYLLEAHRFPFLATLSRPFTKFCLNNAVIPILFAGLYLAYTIHFQLYYELWKIEVVLLNCVGFLSGAFMLILVSVLYFHLTNKDILTFLKIKTTDEQEIEELRTPEERIPDSASLTHGSRRHQVTTYLTESLEPRLVRSVAHYDLKVLMRVFKQNHLNALFVQSLSIVILVILGYMIDNPFFMIPAGASLFIFASVFLALIGSLTYWFNQWRLFVIAFLLFALNYLTSRDMFNYRNKAYGMDYSPEPVPYTYSRLEELCTPENVEADKMATLEILENWKQKNEGPEGEKPVMVMIGVTGGGLRASLWAMRVVQQADSLLQDQLLPSTFLITGSSGGTIGMSYLREIYRRYNEGQLERPFTDSLYLEKISNDMLNGLAFAMVSSDLFLPWAYFESGGYRYRKDRGYVFEKQLNSNTDNWLNRPLSDFKEAEQKAEIPMLFITPSIINDGRRMVISPQKVSYMMTAPAAVYHRNALEVDAIDFGRLFEGYDPYNLNFTTALRMNATYPYVLPNVYLPTEPGIAVMDAGFRDNYGLMSATRFIHVFKDWIKENTSKLILIQIRGRDKFTDFSKANQGVVETILNPFGVAGQITDFQEFEHDSNLGYIFDLLGEDRFHILRFTYNPTQDHERASVTFHLTQREKEDILDAIYLPRNQESFQKLEELFQ
jgi:hypothetical protein